VDLDKAEMVNGLSPQARREAFRQAAESSNFPMKLIARGGQLGQEKKRAAKNYQR
jgi:hypothetical protein